MSSHHPVPLLAPSSHLQPNHLNGHLDSSHDIAISTQQPFGAFVLKSVAECLSQVPYLMQSDHLSIRSRETTEGLLIQMKPTQSVPSNQVTDEVAKFVQWFTQLIPTETGLRQAIDVAQIETALQLSAQMAHSIGGVIEIDRALGKVVIRLPVQRTSASEADHTLLDCEQIINRHLNETHFGIDQLAKKMLLSRSTLQRRVKERYNTSAAALIAEMRIKEAKRLLFTSDLPVSEVATACGYGNKNQFTKAFVAHLGIKPNDFRVQRNQL
jgi:AraC-like DNA-binding protein